MNILIVKLSAIGDVIHTLPALNAIRRRFPGARITWLVEESASALVLGHRALDRVIVYRRKQWMKKLRRPGRKETFKEILTFLRELRDTHYDMIVDFHALFKSATLVWLAKGRRKIGFDKGMQHMEHSYLFLNERVTPVDMEVHALTRQLMLTEALGVHPHEVVYDIPVSDDDEKNARELLRRNHIDGSRPLVSIHPVAKWDTKLWFNGRFADLADHLVREYGVNVVFTGGVEDRPVIEQIRMMMNTACTSLAGKTNLKTLTALYRKAAVVVSTDTGPMHIAAAVGTPVVALFGPTAPWRTGPFGSGHQVIRATVACSPCFQRQCDLHQHVCMKEITVEMVMAGIERLGRLERI